MQPLPVLPGGDGPVLRRADGQDKGSCGETGRGRSRRELPAQAMSQAHERHRAATQSHPGAGGHGEVLRQGQTAELCLTVATAVPFLPLVASSFALLPPAQLNLTFPYPTVSMSQVTPVIFSPFSARASIFHQVPCQRRSPLC